MNDCNDGVQLRAYCGSLPRETKVERTTVLITQLADWAVGARQMHAVIRLPLDGLEEQVRLQVLLTLFPPDIKCWLLYELAP